MPIDLLLIMSPKLPLVNASVSRLLVDLNRSISHPRLYFESTSNEPAELRKRILNHYYQPYHAQPEQ